MVRITLSNEDARQLTAVLTAYLSELRMEVADTENMKYREGLKREEEFLKRLISVLEAEREPYPTGA